VGLSPPALFYALVGPSQRTSVGRHSKSCKPIESTLPAWEFSRSRTPAGYWCSFLSTFPQAVFAILAKEEIPRPNQTHLLWAMVGILEGDDDIEEKLEYLDFYEGPYKLDVPAELAE